MLVEGAQWLSGKVLDSRPRGSGFEPHPGHCVVSLSKNINPSLVLVKLRKTRPFITERLLMGQRIKSNKQTNMCSALQISHIYKDPVNQCWQRSIVFCLFAFVDTITNYLLPNFIKFTYAIF